jgi:hypothetical protein
MEILRPIFLFWSLVDSLHGTFSPPAGSNYTAASSDSFLSSTASAWYRRWLTRRSFVRNPQLSIFRSILRREHEILLALTEKVLPQYEKQSAEKELVKIIESSPGVLAVLTKENLTVQQLLDSLTTVRHE